MSAQDMTLAELAGRSRQAAAALRAAEPKVPAAEGSAASVSLPSPAPA